VREIIAGSESISPHELVVILHGCGYRDKKIQPLAKIGQRDCNWARTTDEKLWLRKRRLDEHVHGSLARAHVAGKLHTPL
jgi:hypothetical protein